MKTHLASILLYLLFAIGNKPSAVVGVYNNPCYERLTIRPDSTFMFTYPVINHFQFWAEGKWEIKNELLILNGQTVYDSIISELIINENADTTRAPTYDLLPLDEYEVIISTDTISDMIDGQLARILSISVSWSRQHVDFKDTLLISDSVLTRIGKSFTECEKLKRIAPNKK